MLLIIIDLQYIKDSMHAKVTISTGQQKMYSSACMVSQMQAIVTGKIRGKTLLEIIVVLL